MVSGCIEFFRRIDVNIGREMIQLDHFKACLIIVLLHLSYTVLICQDANDSA